MSDASARLLTFSLFLGVFAYIIYMFMGAMFQGEFEHRIAIRDSIRPGQHFISGTVMVPSACHQVSVKTQYMGTSTYAIILHTWEEPSVRCEKTSVPRAFSEVLYAPSFGVQFAVFLDGIRRDVDYVQSITNVE